MATSAQRLPCGQSLPCTSLVPFFIARPIHAYITVPNMLQLQAQMDTWCELIFMRCHTGPTPANTPVHGLNSASGMHARTPALSSFPNALTAEFWLTRAKAREDEGDILVRAILLPVFCKHGESIL